MSVLYSTTMHAIGGRSGTVNSDDGLLELKLAPPTALGGSGDATNPEQLFAAGYAACFANAIIHITRNRAHKIRDNDVEVAATVALETNETGGFKLSVDLQAWLAGVDLETANAIVIEAHQVCPYSNATRGNIDVALCVGLL